MNLLPDKFEAFCSRDGEPVRGALLSLTMRTQHKNDYDFIIGPTDTTGKAAISKDEIVRQANNQLNLALMDFSPIEKCYAGDFEVKVLSKTEIKRALEACELFGQDSYPEGCFEKLKNASKLDFDLKKIELNITTG